MPAHEDGVNQTMQADKIFTNSLKIEKYTPSGDAQKDAAALMTFQHRLGVLDPHGTLALAMETGPDAGAHRDDTKHISLLKRILGSTVTGAALDAILHATDGRHAWETLQKQYGAKRGARGSQAVMDALQALKYITFDTPSRFINKMKELFLAFGEKRDSVECLFSSVYTGRTSGDQAAQRARTLQLPTHVARPPHRGYAPRRLL